MAGANLFCEPPAEIHREDGLLHNESGPAVAFRDGWNHWSISGVTVDEQIVMSPKTQAIEQIRKEENEEVRRIRIERFGWARYLDEANASVVELRRNDVEGTDEALMSCDKMKVLVCACPSTGRIYGMEVPVDLENCQQAQNWLRNSETGFSIGAS